MTRFWVPTLLTALLLAAPYTAHAQTSFHASGEFAETFTNGNGTFVDIFAARGCSVSPCTTNNTILVIFGFIPTANGVAFLDGAGVIPDSAFDASSADHATLNVDLSQVSGFDIVACTFTPGTGFTCQPGPTGVIQAEWKRTRAGSLTNLEEDHTSLGPFVIDMHKDQDFFRAAATGSFFGTSFSDSTRARIGTNKDMTITHSKQ
ncbi:MAG TPA: hypothetical protein VG759_27380 [Candidatus Angelobacter sp.]|nr:hypothetical protein [Candidatus Angelobacter sp.]